MLFHYTARDTTGREVTGTIDATSKLEAADTLFNEQKLNVVNISEARANIAIQKPETQAKPEISPTFKKETTLDATHISIGEARSFRTDHTTNKIDRGNLKNSIQVIDDFLIEHTPIVIKDKVIFFRLLSVMINAGLPIVKALRTLTTQTTNRKLKKILEEVSERVEEGTSFSKALTEYSEVFTDTERGVIAAGESSGQLNKTLLDLAVSTEKSANLSRKIKSAMIYPGIIVVIVVAVIIIVMTLVVPKISELFASSNVELPLSTRILITTSNWFIDSTLFIPNWILAPLAIISGFFGIKNWYTTPSGRKTLDRFILNLPIFGKLFKKIALATFAHQLSTVTSAGISIIGALEITANAVGNSVYSDILREVKDDVERGIPINESLKSEPEFFPGLVVHMIAVGEQTAQLSSVTQKIADFYDDEVDVFVKNLSTIMEPLIIVVVGTLVGLLVAAIMQPIMMISDVASQQ